MYIPIFSVNMIVRANSTDPDQMQQNVTADLDLHYLPLTWHF